MRIQSHLGSHVTADHEFMWSGDLMNVLTQWKPTMMFQTWMVIIELEVHVQHGMMVSD